MLLKMIQIRHRNVEIKHVFYHGSHSSIPNINITPQYQYQEAIQFSSAESARIEFKIVYIIQNISTQSKQSKFF